MSLKQRALKKKWKTHKLSERASGPYKVLQTRVNGTLELRPGVSERLNIRRVISLLVRVDIGTPIPAP
jgi:hypothetical protein